MQNHLQSKLMTGKSTTFIFEEPDVDDNICDTILSDSNESTLSSDNNNHHHHNQNLNQNQNGTNNCYNSNHSNLTMTTNCAPAKRKYDDYIKKEENGSNGLEPLSKKLQSNGKKTKGRVKIKMEFIDNKLRRYTTFSKRKTGIMKKAYELSTLTGTQVMLLVASETGHVYTFATRKLQPMITSESGKALIQTCLNSPDPPNSLDQRMSATGFEETDLSYSVNDDSSEKDEDSSSSTLAYISQANNINTGLGGIVTTSSTSSSSANNLAIKSEIVTTAQNASSGTTTPTYTQLQNALPVSFLQTPTNLDTQTISKSFPSSLAGTTFTTAILGGVLPSSALITSSQFQPPSNNSSNSNQATIYKLTDFGSTSSEPRGTNKAPNTPLFNTGSLVLCATSNPNNSTNSSQSVANGNAVMYHTPQGVVYATASNATTFFPESLILNLGQNVNSLGTATTRSSNSSSRQYQTESTTGDNSYFNQSLNKNTKSLGSLKKPRK